MSLSQIPQLRPALYCDIFCCVIDNFGDVGVALRLARQLAGEYDAKVRLIVDDAASYARIAVNTSENEPENIVVCAWQNVLPPLIHMVGDADSAQLLLIEAFGCALPDDYIEALGKRYAVGTTAAPYLCWINLEYLSAEEWVESHHLLPSPHPRLPLIKTFFFPGFAKPTGGLLRERNLLLQRDAFLAASPALTSSFAITPKQKFLIELGVPQPLLPTALFIFLFCYENKALATLLQAWQVSPRPVVCLLPAERTRAVVCTALKLELQELTVGVPKQLGALTLIVTPMLPQSEFDQLLWACDINFVRGEDSIVRAHWAAKPFCWHVYVQDDGAHLIKLDAFLQQFLADAPTSIAPLLRAFFIAWNQQEGNAMLAAWSQFYANLASVQIHVEAVSKRLCERNDCASNIVALLSPL
jgi:uncharacterized repeat protein (TIGR03837 family)